MGRDSRIDGTRRGLRVSVADREDRRYDIPEIMTAPHPPTSPADTKRKTDLNMPHVAAAALAAVTSALLGSKVGAAGTLIGAAGASVITTVGTAVYQSSLERSRKRVRTLAQRTRPSPTSPRGSRVEPSFHATVVDAALRDPGLTDTDPGFQPRHRSRRGARWRWGAVVVGALGAFLIAMTVITGFEWVNGHTVGDNGKGTTIGQVINDPPTAPTPAAPSGSPTPATPESETPTESPTETTQAPRGILPGILGGPTTTPNGVEPTPTATAGKPVPSEVSSTPALIPPGLSGG